MSFKDRENRILELLNQNREVTIEELCAKLFVSAPTIRRDLKSLAETGKIIRTHGGAYLTGLPWESTPQELREKEYVTEKEIIASKCLDLIKDGDTVMIDASSTGLQLLKLLGAKNSIIVVTNSAKAVGKEKHDEINEVFLLVGDACVAVTYAKQTECDEHNSHTDKMVPERNVEKGKHRDEKRHNYAARHTEDGYERVRAL